MRTKHLATLLFVLLIHTIGHTQQHFDFNMFNGEGELRSIYVQRHRLNEKYTFNLDAGSYIGIGNNVWTRWGFRGNINRKLSDFLGSSGRTRATAGEGHLHTMQGDLPDQPRGSSGIGNRRLGTPQRVSG